MAKRSNGEGSVYEDRKNHRWIGEAVIDGRVRRCSGRTRKEAAAKLRQMIQDHQDGALVPTRATLSDLIAGWELDELAHREMAPATRYRFEWQVGILREELGKVKLAQLDASHIHAMFTRLVKGTPRRKAQGHSSLTGLRSTLGQILTYGVGRRLVAVNVAPAARIPADAARPHPRESLTVAQAGELWKACEGHPLGAYIRTAMLTGLRPGEVGGLTRKSLHLTGANPSLTVSRQVQLVKGRPVLRDGVKTAGSYRTIGIPAALVPVLRDHLRDRGVAHPELIFTTPSGTPLNPSNVRRDLAKLCEAHGLPVISPNELRHTAASLLLAQGVPLEQVAKVLGHRSTRMLERHYAHEIRPVITDHLAAMDQLFA